MFAKKLLLLILFLTLSPSFSMANNDAKRVINLAGKQRMLTQKMSKEVMLIALDIHKEDNIHNLRISRDLFDQTLQGLRHGDKELGLPATKDKKILAHLNEVERLWRYFDNATAEVFKKKRAGGLEIKKITALSLPLLRRMDQTVTLYEKDASLKGTDPFLATAINLSGRQRMLTQKMIKEFLLITYGYNVQENKKNLKKTTALFEKTLQGLISGDTSIGLKPAPNKPIKEHLRRVESLWLEMRPLINIALNGGKITDKVKKQIARQNVQLLKQMDIAVNMLEKFQNTP